MLRLNKAKQAARARALRGRAARKPAAPRRPAPTTARRPAPTTPCRPAPPGPVSTPRWPPPGVLRAQSCLGCIKSALAGRSIPLLLLSMRGALLQRLLQRTSRLCPSFS
ncbi:uncharacterized protein BDR25DRAFT_309192 [Lindgomyces ingoldianus]|uniref:Uncharacterized protein n=1 Tax=Lindgomyces ingoldianus TaxID=673940 RepID=A0ACB6RCR0_9PLEO|nr:uncharacterized protein BDR25DRAFT_309192 [Lindgomyces ingoldianus]KAF2476835.1 hypothetical protein BDR25DRAFT_309192 [Lindgomyces ingoldianus]